LAAILIKHRRLAMYLLLFLSTLFIVSCNSVPTISPEKMAAEVYRKDLKVVVDGTTYLGIGVLPLKPSYTIEIYPEEKSGRIIIQSCNRDHTIDKPKTGWFSNKVVYKYQPLIGAELGRNCPLEIATINDKKKNSFAYLEFKDSRPEISLSGTLRCNGEETRNEGVAICQTAEGLRQEIYFNTKVLVEAIGDGCDIMESKDGFFWSWDAVPNECEIYFTAREKHRNGKRLSFRLAALGYTSSPYHE
jgi:hypothetical protein